MDFSNARVETKEPLVSITDRRHTLSKLITNAQCQMIKDAKWITLVKNTYVDADSKRRTWESMERLTRSKKSTVDAVGIVAILQKASGPEVLLQKQFRPPIDKVCVEIPAGLIDEGETPEQCAVRELKEETGYLGTVVPQDGLVVSPVMFNDPGVCNTNLHMVRLSIDLTVAENQDPKPELEKDEFIEAFSVPLANLYRECRSLENQGFAIDARVGTLAEGIELAKLCKVT